VRRGSLVVLVGVVLLAAGCSGVSTDSATSLGIVTSTSMAVAAPTAVEPVITVASRYRHPVLETEAAKTDWVVVLPAEAISEGTYIEDGLGLTPDYVYTIDLDRALSVEASNTIPLPSGTIRIVRSTGSWEPLEALLRPDDRAIMLLNDVQGQYFGHFLAISPDGTIRGVDGFGTPEEIGLISDVGGGGLEGFVAGFAEYSRAVKGLNTPEGLSLAAAEEASPTGAELLVAIRGDDWPIEPANPSREELWEAADPLVRSISPGDAPESVIEARTRVRIIVVFRGKPQNAGNDDKGIVLIRDDVGVLHAFAMGAGTHSKSLWVDPALDLRIDTGRDPDAAGAETLLTTTLSDWGDGSVENPFGVELIVDFRNASAGRVVRLGRAFPTQHTLNAAMNEIFGGAKGN